MVYYEMRACQRNETNESQQNVPMTFIVVIRIVLPEERGLGLSALLNYVILVDDVLNVRFNRVS